MFRRTNMDRSENSVTEGSSDVAILEFFGNCGASRMLIAGAQSVSSGVGPD